MIYGYIRVSTKEQNEDRQLIVLREILHEVLKTVGFYDILSQRKK